MKLFGYVIAVLLVLLTTSRIDAKGRRASCAEVRRAFASKKIGPLKLVPFNAIRTKRLQVCSTTKPTCCTRPMEKKYRKSARAGLVRSLDDRVDGMKDRFQNFLKTFQGDFKDLLHNSKVELRTKLYSLFAFQNKTKSFQKDILSFYDDITVSENEAAIDDVIKRVEKPIRRFFFFLFASNFQQQTSRSLSRKQFKCVLREVERTPSHGIVADLMVERVRSTLNFTTAFLRGIEKGMEVLKTPASSLISSECEPGLVKMQYCSHCYGLTLIKPCYNYCLNVMNGCLVGFAEIDRMWKLYVDGLNQVVEKMFETESDPTTVMSAFIDQSAIVDKINVEEETIREIERACLHGLPRHKRSADKSSHHNDARASTRQHRRRHHRRSGKANFDLSSDPDLSRAPLSSRSIIPPPHKMLRWDQMDEDLMTEPKDEGRENGRRQRENEDMLNELQPDISVLHENTIKPNLKSKFRRFVGKLSLSSNFFLGLPDHICDIHQESSIGISTAGSCWDGREIVKNYNTSVAGKGLVTQLQNPEVDVNGVKAGVIEMMSKLQEAAKMLMLQAGKKKLPDQLFMSPRDVIATGQLEAPCGDDEDACAETASGSEPVDSNVLPHISVVIPNVKKTENRRKGNKKRKKRPKNENVRYPADTELNKDLDVLLAEAKRDSTLSQGGAEAHKNDQKTNKNPNSSSVLFNFYNIVRIISVQLTIIALLDTYRT